jgi:hypothetical protein
MSFIPTGDSNLQNLHNAMEYNQDGDPTIRVTLGSENVTITGNVNVGTTVQVDSTPENPVHVHLTEIGNVTLTNTVPVSGTVAATQSGIWDVEIKNEDGNPISITGEVTTPTDITRADSTYELNVARGLVAGQYQELKNGYASGISANTEVTIWNESITYPWSSWTIAQKLYVKSDSASDVGMVIRIEGLNSSYNKITEDVTINGTTAVATTQNFYRLNRGYLISGNTNIGTIREHLGSSSGTVVGSMTPGFARNKGGFFTVPNGYTAYIVSGDATQFRGGSGNIGGVVKMYTRTGSGPFLLQIISEVVNGHYRNDFVIPLPIPQQTDIDVRLVADGNGTQATCSWQMIMIPN